VGTEFAATPLGHSRVGAKTGIRSNLTPGRGAPTKMSARWALTNVT